MKGMEVEGSRAKKGAIELVQAYFKEYKKPLTFKACSSHLRRECQRLGITSMEYFRRYCAEEVALIVTEKGTRFLLPREAWEALHPDVQAYFKENGEMDSILSAQAITAENALKASSDGVDKSMKVG